jgi:hypothetical protein
MAVNAFQETTFLCFYGNVLVTSFTLILRPLDYGTATRGNPGLTVDDGINVHVNVSYFQAQGVRELSCGRLPILAVVVVESRIRTIYWGRRRYAVYYVRYFVPFSNN